MDKKRTVKLSTHIIELLNNDNELLLVKGGTSSQLEERDTNLLNCGCVKNRRKACKPTKEEIKQEENPQ